MRNTYMVLPALMCIMMILTSCSSSGTSNQDQDGETDMSYRQVNVEILSLNECSGTPPTTELVKTVAANLGVEINLTETKVSTVRDAIDNQFPGSPTVRVNGLDVEPAARGTDQFALT